jgi:asparagine N-glycosylation enzyme membrane subunit Stt3
MLEPEDERSPTRLLIPGLLLVLLSAAALLWWMQGATEGLYGYDGYFHVRYAQVLRSEGISRSFPWWQETFLRDRFADKDFLYHVLLIPFTFGDLVLGGKFAAVLFGTAAMGVFYVVARKLSVPWPAILSLFLLASSTAFLYRLGFTRPLVPAVALSVAGTCAILLRREKWAFAFAAIYPHLHISFHLLPFVA